MVVRLPAHIHHTQPVARLRGDQYHDHFNQPWLSRGSGVDRGLQTGLSIHIVLVGVGLRTLFSRSVLAFEILKWAGVAYAIWLGIQQWRAAGAIDLNTLAKTQAAENCFSERCL